MLPIRRSQKCFAQPEAGPEMMRNGLFRYLLPGDENTEGLKGVSLRITCREGEQAFIGLPCRRSGIRGKRAFQFYGRIPVGAKLRLGSAKSFLCSKRSVELHVSASRLWVKQEYIGSK